MAILKSMAEPKIKATYSLDVDTVRELELMAKRLNISKSAALRRAIRLTATLEPRPGEEQLQALDALQRSLDSSSNELRAWEREARKLRQASSRL